MDADEPPGRTTSSGEGAVPKVNLSEKLARFQELWSPKVVAAVNDFHVKLVKLKGEFVWHSHEAEDELFLVLRGTLRMQFRDHEVALGPGELIVVPHRVEHRPVADEEVHVLLLEPRSTVNTGTAGGERTREAEWIWRGRATRGRAAPTDGGTDVVDVEVRPSRIEGLGVFAARPIAAGERIRRIHVIREITPEAPIREDLGERLDHCSYPDGRTVLFGFPDRHLNHSCEPNAWEQHEGDSSYLVARRDIAAGEEITCDYNINIANGTAWPCRCGAARCRGEVAGDFFRLPEAWQREYRPLLAAWFVRRHRERVAELDREP